MNYSFETETDWVLTRTNALQDYLREEAVSRGAISRYGIKRLVFSNKGFDIYYMQARHAVLLDIRDWALKWIASEPGNWVLNHIANIEVDGAVDITGNTVLSIHASVDESLAVEYVMRWG